MQFTSQRSAERALPASVALRLPFPNKGEGMVWRAVRNVLAAGALIAAVAVCTVRAADEPKEKPKADAPKPADVVVPVAPAAPAAEGCAGDGGSGCAADCGPQYRTVCVTEWKPEQYQTTRTAYRTETREEAYTAYRCEYTCETRTRTCTVNRMVPEVQNVVRTVCVPVPVCEERTVMQARVSYRPVTKMCRKCEDHGHWECHEVPCGPSLCDRLKKCLHHKNDCCD